MYRMKELHVKIMASILSCSKMRQSRLQTESASEKKKISEKIFSKRHYLNEKSISLSSMLTFIAHCKIKFLYFKKLFYPSLTLITLPTAAQLLFCDKTAFHVLCACLYPKRKSFFQSKSWTQRIKKLLGEVKKRETC